MERELANAPLSLLRKFGYLSPNSVKIVSFKIGVILIFSFVFVVALMQNFYIGGGIFEILDNTQLVMAFGQVTCKVILVMINRKKMLDLIELRLAFWNSDECTPKTKKEVDSILSTVANIQKIFLYTIVFWYLLSLLLMFVLDQKVPFGTWSMNEYTKLYAVALPVYLVGLWNSCALAYCIECTFLGFCYEIVVQFKILCDHLERMDVERILDSQQGLNSFYSQLTVYIEHHRFLRSYTCSFQDYFSSIFMIEFVTATPLICLLFYAILESQDLAMTFKYGIAFFLIVQQFTFYCIPLATLSEEVTSVSTAIYNSNWYSKHHLKLKKSTLLMMQQAQQEIRFTAWGLVDMNPQTLVDVLKVAFSTATFFRSLD